MDGDDTDAVAAALAALVRSNGTPMAPLNGGASPGVHPAVDAPVPPAGYGGPNWGPSPAGAGGRDDDDDDANSFDELVAEEVARHSGTADGAGGARPGGGVGEDALPPLPSPTAPSPLDDAEEYPPPSAPPSDGACSDGEDAAGVVPAYAATGLVRGVNTSLPPLPVIQDTVVVPHGDPPPAAASSPALPVEASSPLAHDPPFVPHVATSPEYAHDQSSSSSASSSVALPAAQPVANGESLGYQHPPMPPFPPVAGTALVPPLMSAMVDSSASPPAAAPGVRAVGPPAWPLARSPSWQPPPTSIATATLAHLLTSFSALTSRSVLNHDVLRAYAAHARAAVRVVAPYWRRALVRALLFGNGIVALRDAVAVATAAVAAHPLSRAVTARWAAAHDRVVAAAIVVLALAIRTTADAARRAMAVAAEGVAVHTPRLAATLSRLADAGGGGLTTMGAMSLGKLRLRVQVQPTMTPPPAPQAGGCGHGGSGGAAAAATAVPPAVDSEVRLPPTWLRSLNSSLGGSERRRSARKRASIELSGLTDEGRKATVL
ncbi:hypothetical protein MMPV_002134 [Pyropia vietnamensis]